MNLPTLGDLPNISGKSVLVRGDLNVPLTSDEGQVCIADDFRIRAILPTLHWLVEGGAQVTVCSHLGRPKGKIVPDLSMAPIKERIRSFIPEVEVMENLRFDSREEANSEEFVRELIAGFDCYVNDAFGSSHRAHASIVGPPRYLPSAAGVTLANEVGQLSILMESPPRPYVAVVGGSKVSDKLGLLKSLVTKVDKVLVGGGMCFTFFAALGQGVGDSLLEPELVEDCKVILASGKIVLPVDIATLPTSEPFGRSGGQVSPSYVERFAHMERFVPVGSRGLDIGPNSVELFSEELAKAKAILWNGPMGVFEDPRLSAGTFAIAKAVANSSAFSVVGGGDSAAALRAAGLEKCVTHLSTGGGASLELLEYGDLVGLEALRNAKWS